MVLMMLETYLIMCMKYSIWNVSDDVNLVLWFSNLHYLMDIIQT